MKFNGSLVITSEDAHDDIKRKIPMATLQQRLIATVQLGLFKCDLVMFDPELQTFEKTGFYPKVSFCECG
jgi:hypothetical protein